MRKNVKNEKVIRAMAIGISAMLMASSPLTALAAEGEGTTPAGDDDGHNTVVTPEEGVCDEAEKAADAADEAVEKAEGKAEIVKQDAETVKEEEVGKDLAEDVADAAAKVEDKTVEGGSLLSDAKTAIEGADTQLGVAEANDKLSDAELEKATDAATKASDTAEEMEKEMADAEAKAKVDEQLENIENAASIADANAAYDELEAAANQAQKEFDAKLADYNAAKASYEEAAAKVAEYEKAYNDAIASAGTNAKQAEKELADAQKNAADLEAAVAAAKDAVDASAASAMEIAKKEELTQNDGGLNWRNEDQLFIAIMENYYLPEKLGISGATVTRVQGKDNNDYNYFTAVYKDENGVEQTKYYNFKMDNGSKDDIVIFEKRIEEVNWEKCQNTNPDQYVDEEGNEIDIEKGLENGSVVEAVVKVDDQDVLKYVKKNDTTDSKTLVSNSKITGTSKKDVTVGEKTQESWQYNEETGELVKTVTADVTTITYTDAKFTSEESYATDAERDAAADAMKDKLFEDGIAATGKDATIIKTPGESTYTYTANGTYIPTFTKTVNVNKEYESGILWYEADSEKEAKDKALDWAKDEIDDDLGDYYLVGDIKSDLSVSMTEEETEQYKIFGKTHTIVTDDSDYLVTGTVTATYAKVIKQTVDQSTFGALWDDIKSLFGGQSTNEKLKEAARSAIEADGGIVLSANWDDWNFNKATIRYVEGVKVTTDEKQTEQEAKDAVQGAALAHAKANGATGVYNVKTAKDASAIEHKTYSYEINYLEKDEEKTEGKAIANETYANAEVLTGQIIQNLNYVKGNILLTQDNEEYRAFVDDAKDLTDKYARLLTEAQDAQKAVVAAQEEVDNLQKEIEELGNRKGNLDTLLDLEAKLATAEANRKDAEDILNRILEKLTQAGEKLDDAIERLTPAPAPGAPTGGDEDTDDGDTTVTPPVVLATAPTTPVNVVAPAPVAQPEVVEIAEEVTPLAPGVEENRQEETEKEPEAEETIQLEDEVTPLADIVVEDEHAKMSWWWLLIVVLLGATGYEMYKKHNEKKQKVQAENAEDAE